VDLGLLKMQGKLGHLVQVERKSCQRGQRKSTAKLNSSGYVSPKSQHIAAGSTKQSDIDGNNKNCCKGKGSLDYWVPELIPVVGSQPAGDVSHKPGGRLPLLSARPAVTPATRKRAATNFAAW